MNKSAVPESVTGYWPYSDRLSVADSVVMMESRMVAPCKLRNSILTALHGAHQGVSGMQSRAKDTVFWPGVSGILPMYAAGALFAPGWPPPSRACPHATPMSHHTHLRT